MDQLPENSDNDGIQLYAEKRNNDKTLQDDIKVVKTGLVDFTGTAKKLNLDGGVQVVICIPAFYVRTHKCVSII